MNQKMTLRLLGGMIGFLGPWVALWSYYQFNFSGIEFSVFLDRLLYTTLFAPMLSLAVLINLFLFFGFIWLNKDDGAMGVLFATILYAFVVFGFKLFGA